MFKKQNFPIVLFITASLCVFVLMGFFYIFLSSGRYYLIEPTSGQSERFYLNDNYTDGDSLITKNPSLKDMLAGPIITAADPSLGSDDAPVAIVVFSDFECGFCHRQEQNLIKLVKEYQDKIRLIWKDYPESDGRSISFQAAVAGRCAQKQGQFWPYHDLMFADENDLSKAEFIKIASSLNLDIDAFGDCLEHSATKKLISDNIEEANALDINGVPFVYINDQEVMGESSYEELKRIVDIELESGAM